MKNVSLGIILKGDPQCVQKPPFWFKIIGSIAKYGWLILFPSLIPAIIALINEFTNKDSKMAFGIATLMMFPGAVLYLIRKLWSEKHRCPYCGHFFTMERISADKLVDVSQSVITRDVDEYGSGTAFDLDGNVAFINTKTTHREHGVSTTETYTYNMRCSCCGCVNKVKKSRSYDRYH